jgi:putative SOS response-associated peptidase YedK
MCGRFVILDPEKIMRKYNLEKKPAFTFTARYNIAPSQDVPIVLRDTATRLELMKWGLIPFWAKDPEIGIRLINARAETLAEKPSFRTSLKSKRCLIPSSGFYEWKEVSGRKMPYLIKVKDTPLFSFAGLYDIWLDEQKQEVKTFTIITTAANTFLNSIHNRMPVILNEQNENIWLDKSADMTRLTAMLTPYPAELMEAYSVSPAVNNIKNDSAELIKPIESNDLPDTQLF